ncbi:MAG: DUF2865 domain-containing protein [Rhizobiaceae bacterium]|nr:DUF2865 domain-containing protein [Rhizobiaceae bacterium]
MSRSTGPDRNTEVASPRKAARRAARRSAGLVVGLILALAGTTVAQADVCSALRAKASSGGDQSQVAALNRQFAALQALERKRQCADRRGGGFFDPCGEIRQRKAEVQSKLASLRGSGAGLQARLAAYGCTTRREQPRQSQQVVARSAGPGFGRNSMLFCVREQDGYYFPVPSSQFVDSKDYKQVVDQCQYICKSRDVSVYRLDDPSLESEQMVSVEKGTAYSELKTAFLYRQDANFQGCDFQNYYRRVNEARARTVTPYDLSNALVPLPGRKPEQEQDSASAALLMQMEPASAPEEIPLDARKGVRVVGPDFFPN